MSIGTSDKEATKTLNVLAAEGWEYVGPLGCCTQLEECTMTNLIECSDHKWAPWCVVCTHIFEGTAKEYFRLPASGELQDDWLCPLCFKKGTQSLEECDLHAVCIHCARKLMEGMKKHQESL